MTEVISAVRRFRATDCYQSVEVEAATAADAFTEQWGIGPADIRDAEQAGYPAAPVADRDIDPDGAWATVTFEPVTPTADALVLEVVFADC